jgi:tetratricopeptide (TPR) repeat protein
LFVFILGALGGCSRDPQVLKQKHLEKGKSYAEKGKYLEAAIEFQNAIQIDSKFEPAHYELALCYLKRGAFQQAYMELARAVEIAPDDLKAQLELAKLLLAGRKPADARTHAEIALQGDPNNAEAQIVISQADAAQGNIAKAIDEAQKAIQMDTGRSISYENLAILQARNNDLVSAEQNFKKALELDPKSVPAAVAAAGFYASQKRWPDAERELQAAIALEPGNAALRRDLAGLYLGEGRKDLAEQSLQDAKNSSALKDNPAGYRLLGDFYLSQGELEKASTEFASLYAAHPKDFQVAKTYAEILILRNRIDEAAKVDDAILKNSPSDYEGQVIRGRILTRQGKPNDAIPILETAVKSEPDNSMGHYYLGLAYAAVSNFGQAQYHWLEAARLRPDAPDPQRAIAEYAARSRNTALLVDSSEQLMRIEPHSSEGYIFHAQALLLKGDKAGAEADLKKATQVAPKDSAPYARLGDLRFSEKKFDEAATFYSQALDLNPSAYDALAGLVNIDLERKQPGQALQRVQAQIARVPESSAMYLLLGQVELRNQDSAKAEQAFEKATELDKNNVTAFVLLASTEVSRGSVDQAIASYQHAIQQNPKDARLYVFLGTLFEGRGDWQQAQDQYQKGLAVQSEYPAAANNLAYLMLEHGGNVNVALSLAQTARRGLPNLPNTADTLGWAYYYQGAYSSAISTLQEAVNANPQNAIYHYHLGMAYQKADKYADAKKELKTALQINPNYPQADEIKKILGQSP